MFKEITQLLLNILPVQKDYQHKVQQRIIDFNF